MNKDGNQAVAYYLEADRLETGTPEAYFPFLDERGHVISLVGGGGKTTLLYYLAEQFCLRGMRTVVMTTTKIGCPEHYCRSMEECLRRWEMGRFAVCGKRLDNGKLDIPEPEFLAQLLEAADTVLIEADGARRLPCKAPAAHEPVILPQTDTVIAVMGLDALGKPVEETCLRAEIVQQLLGCDAQHRLTCEDMAGLLLSERGSRKGVGDREFYVVLNKCDDALKIAEGMKVLKRLKDQGQHRAVLTAGMNSFINRS